MRAKQFFDSTYKDAIKNLNETVKELVETLDGLRERGKISDDDWDNEIYRVQKDLQRRTTDLQESEGRELR